MQYVINWFPSDHTSGCYWFYSQTQFDQTVLRYQLSQSSVLWQSGCVSRLLAVFAWPVFRLIYLLLCLLCAALSSVSGVEWTNMSTIKPNWLFVFCGWGWAGGPDANYQPIQSHQCSQREANTHTHTHSHNVNLAPVVLFQLHCSALWLVDLLHQDSAATDKQIFISGFRGLERRENQSYCWLEKQSFVKIKGTTGEIKIHKDKWNDLKWLVFILFLLCLIPKSICFSKNINF